jgi:hypothetical protein
MKKLITITAILLFSLSVFSQEKKDTIGYTATFTVGELIGLVNAIDNNIDSKKASKEIIDYFMKHAKPIVADKPKEQPKVEKPK